MANVYIEPRPKGRADGSPIDDFVVEDGADQVLKIFSTQKGAIDWAKQQGHHPLVARVRHLNNKKCPTSGGRVASPPGLTRWFMLICGVSCAAASIAGSFCVKTALRAFCPAMTRRFAPRGEIR